MSTAEIAFLVRRRSKANFGFQSVAGGYGGRFYSASAPSSSGLPETGKGRYATSDLADDLKTSQARSQVRETPRTYQAAEQSSAVLSSKGSPAQVVEPKKTARTSSNPSSSGRRKGHTRRVNNKIVSVRPSFTGKSSLLVPAGIAAGLAVVSGGAYLLNKRNKGKKRRR